MYNYFKITLDVSIKRIGNQQPATCKITQKKVDTLCTYIYGTYRAYPLYFFLDQLSKQVLIQYDFITCDIKLWKNTEDLGVFAAYSEDKFEEVVFDNFKSDYDSSIRTYRRVHSYFIKNFSQAYICLYQTLKFQMFNRFLIQIIKVSKEMIDKSNFKSNVLKTEMKNELEASILAWNSHPFTFPTIKNKVYAN